MTPSYLVSAFVASYMCIVQGQSSCKTPNGVSGQCINLYNCKSLLDILNSPNRTPQDVQMLQRSQCGYEKNTPKVCCPSPPTEPLDRRCYTPDAKEGTCIGLFSCPLLANLLQPPVPKDNLLYVQNSRCDSPDQYSVCCGSEPMSPAPKPSRSCTPSAASVDPRTECCGLDSSGGNRIFGGNVTAIDQYPWLTLIEYKATNNNKIKLLCGGALVSGKYVLTAGHCVVGPVLSVGTPTNVRLGEYDVSHSGPDCVNVEGGGTDCTDGAMIIAIEKVIPHADYNPSAKLRRNDIALLRLQDMAPYTDFIRPICLPTTDITANPSFQARLEVAGWGAVSETQSFSNIKLHVDLPLATKSQCEPYYAERQVPLWSGQICAGGEKGKDSCKGDSGGALMNEKGRIWEIVGIVSFGPTPCGMENIPGVYTKVYEYLPWIRTQMKP